MDNYEILLKQTNQYIQSYIYDKIKNKKFLEICKHALNGGKRLRPILCVATAQTILKSQKNKDICMDIVWNYAIGIEIIHNCSLIIDDMPCMDDDKIRRDKKTIWYKYGKTVAQLLVSYLCKEAFMLLTKNLDNSKESLKLSSIILNNLGISGVVAGQYIDTRSSTLFKELHLFGSVNREDTDIAKLKELLRLKTTTLFEISIISGYILCNKNTKDISIIQKAINHFGLLFQISDDFEDLEQDNNKQTETVFIPNMVRLIGKDKAYEIFMNSKYEWEKNVNYLEINNIVYKEIINYLIRRVQKYKI